MTIGQAQDHLEGLVGAGALKDWAMQGIVRNDRAKPREAAQNNEKSPPKPSAARLLEPQRAKEGKVGGHKT